jgi:hypothetical protein
VVTASMATELRGLARSTDQRRHRGPRALGVALATLALGLVAALLVASHDNPLVVPASTHRTPLPGDLFAAPVPPKPIVIVRYTAPRAQHSAPMSGQPSAQPSARPSARPSGGGGDD